MRLTIKTDDSSYKIGDFLRACKAIDKLGQLEDIEEELSTDLATLAKAFKILKPYLEVCYYGEEEYWLLVGGRLTVRITQEEFQLWKMVLIKEELENG